MSQELFGTNCGNCKHFASAGNRVLPLNAQGGLVIAEANVPRAKAADLITLPTRARPELRGDCLHPEVIQPVNDRMCCAFWDNVRALRQWKGVGSK